MLHCSSLLRVIANDSSKSVTLSFTLLIGTEGLQSFVEGASKYLWMNPAYSQSLIACILSVTESTKMFPETDHCDRMHNLHFQILGSGV